MRKFAALVGLFAAITLVGCNKGNSTDNKTPASKTSSNTTAAKTAVATIAPSKSAATQPANKDVTGTVTFTATKDGVKVVADLTGLSPGKHGIHIHEKSDLSDPMLKSAGGHWNPDAQHHGGPTSESHHAGDLGNVTADADGKAHLEMTLDGLTIGDGGKHDVVGHSIVVHAKEDDLKSDPAGNSGDRIAAGVIEAK
jgi:Cu-Zn family superoxide dismutase